jgi:hypothetical protein
LRLSRYLPFASFHGARPSIKASQAALEPILNSCMAQRRNLHHADTVSNGRRTRAAHARVEQASTARERRATTPI